MSRSTQHTFSCPCGTTFHSPIYEYVNTAHAPQLQYTVLAGLLNVATCPHCGRRSALARSFIYSDPAHALLVYVDPRSDVPDEARQIILDKLSEVYVDALEKREHVNGQTAARELEKARQDQELPPLRVVFGLERLCVLINAALSQEERLGRLALSTQSHSEAERGRMHDLAHKLALEMQCQIEVEDLPEEYTVWVYGSRRQIGALMRELAPRG